MTVLIGASAFFVGNAYQAQMPGFAFDLGHGRADFSYSALLAADAAGGLAAGVVLESRGLLPPRPRTAFILAMLWCCALFGFARSTSYALAIALLLAAGFVELEFQFDGAIAGAIECAGRDPRPGDRGIFNVCTGIAHFQRTERRPARLRHRHSQFAELQCCRAVYSVRGDFRDPLRPATVALAKEARVGSSRDVDFMHRALELAQRAALDGEVPVGALLVLGDEVIGEGWNRPIMSHDPTAHAEVVALRAAAQRLRNYRLERTTLYVTLEPCAMCMGAALNARVSRVVFGAWDPKAGACGSVIDLPREPKLTHRVDVFGGVCSDESAALLRDFFESRR